MFVQKDIDAHAAIFAQLKSVCYSLREAEFYLLCICDGYALLTTDFFNSGLESLVKKHNKRNTIFDARNCIPRCENKWSNGVN